MFKIFYILKPFIPRNIQLYLRKKLIQSKLNKYKGVWPVLKGSEKKPENWKGWPDSKRFAVVLTHDVEHQKGYKQVMKLLEVEKKLGFVSSFNFVPERDYVVEKKLLDTIKQNGFEYGIHGLNHDGKLFSSEEEFLKRSKKINHYLNEWGAVGFRAPAMHHNLDWIGALDIQYDLSTFDTDPFEPQPDGVGTIFPFGVRNKRNPNRGFVEMPYTVPQDFLLFILMREKSTRIWEEKTEWIAENGGMLLLNVHPDYINFEDNKTKKREEFSLKLYSGFLEHINSKYGKEFINILPNELARFIRLQSNYD